MDHLSRYKSLKKIGEGAYGIVYMANDSISKTKVALKRIRLDKNDDGVPPTTIREISLLKELNHCNIVKLYNVFHNGKNLYLVFEHCDTDLCKFLNTTSNFFRDIRNLRNYMQQILSGLAYCHQQRIIHRDLKPQNLLINRQNNIIKLADFGLARSFCTPVRNYTREVVTLWYRAPELLLGTTYYGTSLDIWSIGCIFGEMASGKTLFQGESEIDQLFKIFHFFGTPDEKLWPGFERLPYYSNNFPKWRPKNLNKIIQYKNKSVTNLLKKMLIYNPSERISALAAMKKIKYLI